jgi:adenylate cyclase
MSATDARETSARITLEMLLEEALARPDDFERIAQEIEDAFGRRGALLVLDMVGVSKLARQDGIVAFLLAVHRMRAAVTPIVEELGGVVLEAKADDFVGLFEDVPNALTAARRIVDSGVGVSVGVGYGSVLQFDDGRIAGLELNLASKLGEDLARPGEILLTAEAQARVGARGEDLVARRKRISGLELTYFAVRR